MKVIIEWKRKGNTAQGIINAANTASTVKQTVEQVNRLQTALDYVQKLSLIHIYQ